jgi:hypothetical protein
VPNDVLSVVATYLPAIRKDDYLPIIVFINRSTKGNEVLQRRLDGRQAPFLITYDSP